MAPARDETHAGQQSDLCEGEVKPARPLVCSRRGCVNDVKGSADVDPHGDCLKDFTDESGCKGDMNGELSKRKGRLVLTKQHSDAILRHLELDYKLFLNEIEHIASKQKCLDVNLKVAGCYLCDNRLKPMLNVPVQSNLQLKNYISFSPPSVFGPGHFTYSRMWNGKYDFLPSGEAQARSRTEKLLQRINKNDNKIAREATFRLQQLFVEQGLSWASPFDLNQNCKFLGLLAILKQGRTTSVRVCSIPNSEYKTEIGSLTYNNCIQTLSVSQPRPYQFNLAKLFSLQTVTSDITQQFPSIYLSYPTSLASIFFCYKDIAGWPTFCSQDSIDKKLYAIKNQRLYFGGADAPAVAEFCMLEACSVFLQHHHGLSSEERWLVDKVDSVLHQSRFADDLQQSTLHQHVLDYCQVTKTQAPLGPVWSEKCLELGSCSTDHISMTESEYVKFCRRMNELSELVTLKIALMMQRILNYCGFSLKFLKGPVDLQARLDDIVMRQTIHRTQNKVRVDRPDPSQVSRHINRLNANADFVNHVFEDAEDKEEKHEIEHLGYVYCKDRVSLRIKSLSLIYFDGKTNKKSPDFHSEEQFRIFMREVKPTFTRRSLFSAAAKNFDTSGRFLV